MTTNRMGLEQEDTLTDERIEQFIRQPMDNGLARSEQMELAREIQARREASKEPIVFIRDDDAKSLKSGDVAVMVPNNSYCKIPIYAAPPIQAVTVPDGWQLVPVELTDTMRDAWDSAPIGDDDDLNMQNAYRAMIAAAPKFTNEP